MNIKQLYLFGFIFVLLGSLMITSCSDEEGLDTIVDAENPSARDKGSEGSDETDRILDLPTVNGDRYAFRDFDHLTNYYTALDEIYSNDDQQFNSVTEENRRGVNTVHDKLVNDEFVSPSDRYQPFLNDPVMMAIVNEHFEFEVENVLITYMNNRDLLISEPNDFGTRSAIRVMEKGGELDFADIPAGAYWGEDTNAESLKAWCGCSISIEQISCNEVRVFGSCKNFIFGGGGGLVEIFLTTTPGFPGPDIFGNFPTPLQSNTVDGNFSFTIPVTSSTSSIFIHASANPDCFVGNTQRVTLEFDPDEASCDFNEKATPYLWAQDNGVQGYSHRTSYYKNFWSSYEEAKMWSKWWDGSKWKPNKASLRVNIDAVRKNDVCQQFEQENETKTCYCKDKRARVNSGISGVQMFVHHCDGDVTGTYKKTLNWNGMTWAIDAVGEVDFECCE